MNTKILQIFSLIILIFGCGCGQKKGPEKGIDIALGKVIIEGHLNEGVGKKVVLEEMAAREFIPLDTTWCDDAGNFSISISPDQVAFYVLRYGPSGYVTMLIEPGEKMKYHGYYNNNESYKVEGSEGSLLLQKLSSEHGRVLKELGKITRKNMEGASSPNYAEIKLLLDQKFDSITNSFRSYSLDFINQHVGSLAILVALYNMYGQGLPVFYPEDDFYVYQFVDSALMSNYSGFQAVELLNAQIAEAKQLLNKESNVKQIQRGEIAPDFVSSRPDGGQLALSDLRGNYVLLSFWAGWSHMSREENVSLRKVFERFGMKDFKILQVSLDDNRNVWTNAIDEDQLIWDHVSSLSRWDNPVAELYQVDKIPLNVLIDPLGKIIEIDLFDEKLLEKLELIFSE